MEELLNNDTQINRFNVRVYGIAINSDNNILLCKEKLQGMEFTKFPGGGLEYGEGTIDCLYREFKEELNAEIEIVKHFYTTDFFQQSAFKKTDQLLSIYYIVKLKNKIMNYVLEENGTIIQFFWKPFEELTVDDLTLPIDKLVAGKLMHTII
jgi:8-oxo-dGTP diphosphatase